MKETRQLANDYITDDLAVQKIQPNGAIDYQ